MALLRYTLEALQTQARRARDYDPGKSGPDAVLALYLPELVRQQSGPDDTVVVDAA